MKVFIDGSSGTTGLRIRERLATQPGIELINLPDSLRKDPSARRDALNSCDTAVLCLPDAAARESVSLVENPAVRILDTSTAHRTADGWTYGFPELSPAQHEAVRASRRVAVPGCHASGFIALVYPLVAAGLLPETSLLSFSSITGYSGGGKAMIADYEAADRPEDRSAPRQYGLTQQHKHLPEIGHYSLLEHEPVFTPIVSDYYSGMVVTVPLFRDMLTPGTEAADLAACYRQAYPGPVLTYTDQMDAAGFISANTLSGSDAMEVTVAGNEERILLIARYDNLGKGASGAALQCLNLMNGRAETGGLVLQAASPAGGKETT